MSVQDSFNDFNSERSELDDSKWTEITSQNIVAIEKNIGLQNEVEGLSSANKQHTYKLSLQPTGGYGGRKVVKWLYLGQDGGWYPVSPPPKVALPSD